MHVFIHAGLGHNECWVVVNHDKVCSKLCLSATVGVLLLAGSELDGGHFRVDVTVVLIIRVPVLRILAQIVADNAVSG